MSLAYRGEAALAKRALDHVPAAQPCSRGYLSSVVGARREMVRNRCGEEGSGRFTQGQQPLHFFANLDIRAALLIQKRSALRRCFLERQREQAFYMSELLWRHVSRLNRTVFCAPSVSGERLGLQG